MKKILWGLISLLTVTYAYGQQLNKPLPNLERTKTVAFSGIVKDTVEKMPDLVISIIEADEDWVRFYKDMGSQKAIHAIAISFLEEANGIKWYGGTDYLHYEYMIGRVRESGVIILLSFPKNDHVGIPSGIYIPITPSTEPMP